MSTGVGIGDLLAVADVGAVWANAGEGARATFQAALLHFMHLGGLVGSGN